MRFKSHISSVVSDFWSRSDLWIYGSSSLRPAGWQLCHISYLSSLPHDLVLQPNDRLYNCLSGAELLWLQLKLFLHLRRHISPSCMFVSVCRPFIGLGHGEQSKQLLVSVFSYLMIRLLCLQCLNSYHYRFLKTLTVWIWSQIELITIYYLVCLSADRWVFLTSKPAYTYAYKWERQ